MLIGFDFETHRIGPGNVIPPPVCLSSAVLHEGEWDMELATKADGNLSRMDTLLDAALTDPDIYLVAQNAAFDLGVACRADTRRFAKVFQLLMQGKIKDTMLREMILDLAEHGYIGAITTSSGAVKQVQYSLAALAKRYLGVDLSEAKDDPNSWRLNYAALEEFGADKWPQEAVNYALMDSVYAVQVYEAQEERRERVAYKVGRDPLDKIEDFRGYVNFCLLLITFSGMRVDPVEHGKIKAMLQRTSTPDNFPHLVRAGFLIPGKPEMPYKNGAKCSKTGKPKMKRATKEKIAQKKLKEFVFTLMTEAGEELFLTDKGIEEKALAKKEGIEWEPSPAYTSVSSDFLKEHAHRSPILEEYQARQKLQKLITTEMPRMEWPHGSGRPAKVIHPTFDCLKNTGRTSSKASKLFPSLNGQNVDPRARGVVIARKGFYLYSVDVSSMELCTLAQKCLNQFGWSKLADAINAGFDVHAYLGAQLANNLNEDFAMDVAGRGLESHEDIYHYFLELKGKQDEQYPPGAAQPQPLDHTRFPKTFFKHFRKFAKPTGLGYPGGLGAKTFVAYAAGTYGVKVDLETAKFLKEVWFSTYPEMRSYFAWIKKECVDPHGRNERGNLYRYETPMGMVRSKATFCAASNGAGLQAFSAEGALLGLVECVTRTFMGEPDILSHDDRGVTHRVLNFVHDELVGECRIDVADEVTDEVGACLVRGLRAVCPDVTIRTEPAIMRRWDKAADPVYGDDGRLIPWEDRPRKEGN